MVMQCYDAATVTVPTSCLFYYDETLQVEEKDTYYCIEISPSIKARNRAERRKLAKLGRI